MSNNINVSIIIPVYNDEKGLASTLESLKKQSYPSKNTEIIVIDNGSTDQSIAVAKSFTNVIILEEKHPGSYAARNKGILSASHSVLAFLDAESIAHQDWLLEGIKALEQINFDGLVGGRIKFTFTNQDNPNIFELYDSITNLNNKKNIEEYYFSVTANMFTTKTIFDQTGLFVLSLKSGGDREWGERVRNANKSIIFASKALNFHHARQTVKELITKTRRVTGGLIVIEYQKQNKITIFLSMLLVPPIKRMSKIMKDKTLGNIKVRLGLASLIYFLKLIAAFELLRLELGYESERK